MTNAPDTATQKLILGAMVLHVWAELNGGREPCTIWQYRRLARRLGLRVHWLPRDCDAPAMHRQGVIYIRRTHDAARLRREFVHELGEAVSYWDGCPPCVCALTRHDVACQVVRMAA